MKEQQRVAEKNEINGHMMSDAERSVNENKTDVVQGYSVEFSSLTNGSVTNIKNHKILNSSNIPNKQFNSVDSGICIDSIQLLHQELEQSEADCETQNIKIEDIELQTQKILPWTSISDTMMTEFCHNSKQIISNNDKTSSKTYLTHGTTENGILSIPSNPCVKDKSKTKKETQSFNSYDTSLNRSMNKPNDVTQVDNDDVILNGDIFIHNDVTLIYDVAADVTQCSSDGGYLSQHSSGSSCSSCSSNASSFTAAEVKTIQRNSAPFSPSAIILAPSNLTSARGADFLKSNKPRREGREGQSSTMLQITSRDCGEVARKNSRKDLEICQTNGSRSGNKNLGSLNTCRIDNVENINGGKLDKGDRTVTNGNNSLKSLRNCTTSNTSINGYSNGSCKTDNNREYKNKSKYGNNYLSQNISGDVKNGTPSSSDGAMEQPAFGSSFKMILSPRKLLDKLLITCPNSEHCQEVLPRKDLQIHLIYRCQGTLMSCINSMNGCGFRGIRSSVHKHLEDCQYHDKSMILATPLQQQITLSEDQIITVHIYRGNQPLGISIVGGTDTPLISIIIQEVYKSGVASHDGRLLPGDQLLEINGLDLTRCTHLEAVDALNSSGSTCHLLIYREPSDTCLHQHHHHQHHQHHHQHHHHHHRISHQQNNQNYLVHHQQYYHPKSSYLDSNCDLIQTDTDSTEQKEIIEVTLTKLPGKQLGIKLIQKADRKGLYILEIIEGGVAYWDGRLEADDQILEINNEDMTCGSQEQAVNIIQNSTEEVRLVVSRLLSVEEEAQYSPRLQDLEDQYFVTTTNSPTIPEPEFIPDCWREKIICVDKDPSSSLGVSIAGGRSCGGYDTPIYISNVQSVGCLASTGRIMKGDVLVSINGLSLLGLTHGEVVQTLRDASSTDHIQVQLLQPCPLPLSALEDPEEFNFKPSWKYWLSMPGMCHTVKTITLERSPLGSLGFSIVGGYTSHHGSVPVYVKSVVYQGPAGRDGRLRSGDRILSVNDHSLGGATHSEAAVLLTRAETKLVTLTVVSWPGSPL